MRRSFFIWNSPRGMHRLEAVRTGGALDHYFHFIMDLVWPLFRWKGDLAAFAPPVQLCVLDPTELHFAPAMQRLMGLNMTAAPNTAPGTPAPLRLQGFNPRNGDHLAAFGDRASFREGRDRFVQALAQRSGTGERTTPLVVLVERATVPGDRGASRRHIADHAALADILSHACAEQGIAFRNVLLEDMDVGAQFTLFHGGPMLLIGQHGAGLVNGLWMTDPRSAVIELAGADNPPHFTHLFTDLGMKYLRVVCPGPGEFMTGQRLSVDAQGLAGEVRAWAAIGKGPVPA